jgi:hypothetical protein
MKTKSLKSLTALIGAVVALNVSVLAGPGPQSQPVTRKASVEKKTTTVAVFAKEAPATKSETEPKLFTVDGPRGMTFTFRR